MNYSKLNQKRKISITVLCLWSSLLQKFTIWNVNEGWNVNGHDPLDFINTQKRSQIMIQKQNDIKHKVLWLFHFLPINQAWLFSHFLEHSTEVAYLLLTQQLRVWFPALPKKFQRKNYRCCWGQSVALVEGKWTVASQYYKKSLSTVWHTKKKSKIFVWAGQL